MAWLLITMSRTAASPGTLLGLYGRSLDIARLGHRQFICTCGEAVPIFPSTILWFFGYFYSAIIKQENPEAKFKC